MLSLRRASLIALLSLLPCMQAMASGSARVLPVLSQESGRVEALLLLDDTSVPAHSDNPLDRVFSSPLSAAQPASGPRLQLDNGARIGADLSFDAQNGLALLCRGNIGLAAALDTLGEHCLLAEVSASDPLMPSAQPSRHVGLDGVWQSADGDFDIRFGLAWLDASPRPAAHGFVGLADAPVMALEPGGLPSSLSLLDIQVRQVGLSGQGRIGQRGWLGIDGDVSRGLAAPLFGVPVRWDSTALSLRGGYGSFSGVLTGRLIEVPSEAQVSWVDVDLGVSWRTPWRARLTVGARNLLGQPDASQWPLPTLPRGHADADTRMPYIRYHQDL